MSMKSLPINPLVLKVPAHLVAEFSQQWSKIWNHTPIFIISIPRIPKLSKAAWHSRTSLPARCSHPPAAPGKCFIWAREPKEQRLDVLPSGYLQPNTEHEWRAGNDFKDSPQSKVPLASRCKFFWNIVCAEGHSGIQLSNFTCFFSPPSISLALIILMVILYLQCFYCNPICFISFETQLLYFSFFPRQYSTPCAVSRQVQVWACGRQSIKWIYPQGYRQTNTKSRQPEEQVQDETLFPQSKHRGGHKP